MIIAVSTSTGSFIGIHKRKQIDFIIVMASTYIAALVRLIVFGQHAGSFESMDGYETNVMVFW